MDNIHNIFMNNTLKKTKQPWFVLQRAGRVTVGWKCLGPGDERCLGGMGVGGAVDG